MANGQILEVGAQIALNRLAANVIPVVSSTAPTWEPGLYWVDSGHSYTVKEYNGSAWVTAGSNRYLALAISDPTAAVDMTGVVEVQTAGYGRQQVLFTAASAAYPSELSNNATITWTFTADMLLAAEWVVLVTTASGNLGWPLYAWQIEPQQVSATQSITAAIGAITLSAA